VALEEAAEIGRVVEAQLEGQLRHRRRHVHQPARGFARQAGMDHLLHAGAGLGAHDAVQPLGRQPQLLRVARHRPVLAVVRFQQRQPARVERMAAGRAARPCAGFALRALRQPPDDGARQPQRHRAVAGVAVGGAAFGVQRLEQGVQPHGVGRRRGWRAVAIAVAVAVAVAVAAAIAITAAFEPQAARLREHLLQRVGQRRAVAFGQPRRVEGEHEAVGMAREAERVRHAGRDGDGRRAGAADA